MPHLCQFGIIFAKTGYYLWSTGANILWLTICDSGIRYYPGRNKDVNGRPINL